MGSAEKFCLRWNDFETNVSQAFRELREEKDFFDVTLACEDSQVQAHKVILSACSPFFRSVLRKNPHAHPLLYLKGVKYQELLSVLNFMYMGEVNVAQEELNSFLAVAEELRVKGLTQGEPGSGGAVGQEPPGRGRQEELGKILEVAAAETVKTEPREVQPPYSQPANRQPYNQPTSRQTYSQPASRQPYSQSVSRQAAKQQPFGASSHASPEPYSGSPGGQAGLEPYGEELEAGGYGEESALATEETYQGEEEEYGEYGADFGNGYGEQADYSASGAGAAGGPSADMIAAREEEIVSNIVKDTERKMFICVICQFGASSRHKVFCHLESKHFRDSSISYSCPFCEKQLSSRNSLGIHVSRNHKHERGNSLNSIFPKDH